MSEWVDAAYRLADAAGRLNVATDGNQALRSEREDVLAALRALAAAYPAHDDHAGVWRRGVRGAVQALDRTLQSRWKRSGRRQWRDAASELGMALQALHDETLRHAPNTWREASALDDALVDAIVPLIGSSETKR